MDNTNKTQLFNWKFYFDSSDVIALGDDLILLDKPCIKTFFESPFKVNVTTAIICTAGKWEGYINLTPNVTKASSLIIILPGQILEHKYISDDFEGHFIIMSQAFINNLHIQTQSSLFYSISDNPSITLSDEGLSSILRFYSMLKEAIQANQNPYRLETVMFLTKAFFYGTSYSFHKEKDDSDKSKQQIVVDNFLELAKKFYKKERGIIFYADKLCITPKYLSHLVKKNSNQSANDWINRYVILEAKALLKSTNLTIEQISDELNFSSQSFFGKYFKRITGLSPKDYKNKTIDV